MSINLLICWFTIVLFLIGCEAENPGEPVANILPDTHISEAFTGNITTIYFYGTDEDGYIIQYAYKWDTDAEWSNTTYDSATFINVFADQNEVKRFYVKAIVPKIHPRLSYRLLPIIFYPKPKLSADRNLAQNPVKM